MFFPLFFSPSPLIDRGINNPNVSANDIASLPFFASVHFEKSNDEHLLRVASFRFALALNTFLKSGP